MHVRLEGRTAALRPIAGTRPRGATPAADAGARTRAAGGSEGASGACHAGRPGAQRPRPRLRLRHGSGARVDDRRALLARHAHRVARRGHACGRASTASTWSGPRSRPARSAAHPRSGRWRSSTSWSMAPRGPYAGLVGYFSYDGSLDTCITIRTLVMQGQEFSVQAGAGIVADSVPEREHQESVNKAALRRWPRRPLRTTAAKESCDDRSDRQLRLIHLQPGPVLRRVGRGGLRVPERRSDRTRDRGAGTQPHRHLAGTRARPQTPASRTM